MTIRISSKTRTFLIQQLHLFQYSGYDHSQIAELLNLSSRTLYRLKQSVKTDYILSKQGCPICRHGNKQFVRFSTARGYHRFSCTRCGSECKLPGSTWKEDQSVLYGNFQSSGPARHERSPNYIRRNGK